MNKTRAYLYTYKDDNTINVHEGYVEPIWHSQWLFTADNGHRYYVSNKHAALHYRKLWLTTRNDDLARQIYVEYHRHKIEELEQKLKAHKQAIADLKGRKK
jgi:hypothetical protein